MNITPHDLDRHLKQQPRNTFIYLITGDEILLIEESIQRISMQARAEGYTERWIIEAEMADAMDRFLSHTQNLSFLSAKKIIEVRFPQKVTAAWSTLFIEVATHRDPNQIILIRVPKLSKAETQAKWYKAFDQAGCIVTIWPLKQDVLLRWIHARFEAAGMKVQKESILRIAASTEGNLLATAQVIEKLQIIQGTSSSIVSYERVCQALSDQANYNVFELGDALLAQKPEQCLKILATLQNQGTEPPIVLWALMQEVRNLAALSAAPPTTRSSLFQKRNIWGPRQALYQKILSQVPSNAWNNLLKKWVSQARVLDEMIKGIKTGDIWTALEIFCLSMSQIKQGLT